MTYIYTNDTHIHHTTFVLLSLNISLNPIFDFESFFSRPVFFIYSTALPLSLSYPIRCCAFSIFNSRITAPWFALLLLAHLPPSSPVSFPYLLHFSFSVMSINIYRAQKTTFFRLFFLISFFFAMMMMTIMIPAINGSRYIHTRCNI